MTPGLFHAIKKTEGGHSWLRFPVRGPACSRRSYLNQEFPMRLKMMICAVVLSMLAAAAYGNPREGSTFTNVASDGYFPGHRSLLCIGNYPVSRISIDGTLTTDYINLPASDTTIYVTAPDGQHFSIQPFSSTIYNVISTPAGGYTATLPTQVASAAGVWYFEFNNWPDHDYNYYEASWLNVCIRLGDSTSNPGTSISAYTYAEPVVAGLNTSHLRVLVAP